MQFPWQFYNISMCFLWDFYWVSMRFLWGLYEISMGFLWDSCGISIYIGFLFGFKIISCCVIKENKSKVNVHEFDILAYP